ncbi:unnamed protein product [Blepharisma stoltei]|uniref:EGF-like domain-containing protein n=1 Tax=Blepharisma stoltei TaxID=1481888 RepID=A0AAU9K408_9CILI|nr:unnamed protein product [Blepharisma stoltei]
MVFELLLLPLFVLGCTEPPSHNLQFSERRKLLGPPVTEPNWEGIRIKTYFEASSSSSFSSSLSKEYIPNALNYYNHAIKVVKVSTLTVSSTSCLNYTIPSELNKGITDGDVAILFKYNATGDDLAWAQICEVDPDLSMRPILGVIYIQGTWENKTWEQIYAQVVHQIAHILVFNAKLLPYFSEKQGEWLGISNVLGSYYRRSSEVSYIKTSSVINKAEIAFGCNNLYGMDLASITSDTASSIHWSKRLMFNDFMVPDSDVYYVVYSDISLALFQDSGWYQANYDYSDTIVWGYQAGCTFFTDSCVTDGAPNFSNFCNLTSGTSYCDATHTFKGMCNLGTYTDKIPAEYQYFSSPYMGGDDKYLDYCPVVMPNSDGSCRDLLSIPVDLNYKAYGEQSGDSSRCLEGTYVNKLSNFSINYHAGCHKITCQGSIATVHIGQEVIYCTPSGGLQTIRGYNGVIKCPPSDILCRNLPCINGCSGRGLCVDGSCNCDSGYSGNSCENRSETLMNALFFLMIFVII